MTGGAAAPRYARPFVATFLLVLVLCGSAAWNLWPFSSWELFSRLRTDRQSGWEAFAVDESGRARGYPTTMLPHGTRGFASFMNGFPGEPAAERNATCTAWLHDATEHTAKDTRRLRIYRLQWVLSDRRGDRAAPPHRTLAWTCSAKGARAAA